MRAIWGPRPGPGPALIPEKLAELLACRARAAHCSHDSGAPTVPEVAGTTRGHAMNGLAVGTRQRRPGCRRRRRRPANEATIMAGRLDRLPAGHDNCELHGMRGQSEVRWVVGRVGRPFMRRARPRPVRVAPPVLYLCYRSRRRV